ncbi:unnamed protein product [Cuscuta epithymum]|uniref:Terpene synthase N-terminal domain-containing protein n=1 Tax=Cuscuta epithymum TaxID=186058 RepID=A0AAV0DZG5_9ASTE|nr:unnamed protein product [Cuscuta epithymum]
MHFSTMSAEQNMCSSTIGGYSRVRAGPLSFLRQSPSLNILTVKFTVSTDKHDAFFPTPKGAYLHRRSAIYQPNIWNYDFIESLYSEFGDVEHQRRAHKLKEEVLRGLLLDESLDAVAKLELIDNTEKMAISHHFEKEIAECLNHIMLSSAYKKFLCSKMDLYATALYFRVLRRYGHDVSQDVFVPFLDEMGDCSIKQEPRTILELLEASFLALDGEIILFKARIFCTETLRNVIVSQNGSDISHRLSELPLHWTPPWFAARREISRLEKDNSNSKYSNLFYFAKLNFNIVQAEHQKN